MPQPLHIARHPTMQTGKEIKRNSIRVESKGYIRYKNLQHIVNMGENV